MVDERRHRRRARALARVRDGRHRPARAVLFRSRRGGLAASSAPWRFATTIDSRARDVERIAAAAKSSAAAIVLTTDKDAVRWAACDLGDLPIASVPLTATVEPVDEFRAWLFERLWLRHAPRVPGSYVAVETIVASCLTPVGASAVRARCSASLWYTFDRARRRIAEANLAAAFPSRSAAGAARDSSARRSRTSSALVFEMLKFSTLSPEQMLARVEFDGEERVAARLRAGQGRAVHHRPLRLLGAARHRAPAAASSRSACWRARSTTCG